MSDAAVITTKLKQVHRRQFMMLLLRCICVAAMGFVLWGALWASGIFGIPRPSVFMLVTSAAAAFFISFIIALVRRPSRKDAAKRMDGALGLEQRVVTSCECIPPREEIDNLLLRDVSRRIQSIRPADIEPFQFGRIVGISLVICLIVISSIGIIRILQDLNRRDLRQVGNPPEIVAGSSPQSKNAPKEVAAKNRNNTGIMHASPGDASDPASKGRSTQTGPMRDLANFSDQVQVQSSPNASPVSTADRGSAERLEGHPQTAMSLKSGIRPESRENKMDREAGKGASAASGDIDYARNGSSGAGPSARSDSGISSIRKAEREGGRQKNGPASWVSKESDGNLLSGGQPVQTPNKQSPIGNSFPLMDRYPGNSLAIRSAMEQALEKERIPPGLKKYIADYFKAIHQ